MAKKISVATFTPDTNNEMFQLAIQLVNQSNRNIFLTGKAGTGKTTFLKYIRENCPKQMAVIAPTGVAAINAGGVTIHSFFQLPFAPFIPETKGMGFPGSNEETTNRHSLVSRLRFNSDKKKVLQQLELLIIDEISMVRCDTLDAIDTVLRHVRQRPAERFGGVQLLFIGDMLQLPPVIKDQEWRLLSSSYTSQYFFDSKVLEDQPPLYIEFNKIYRQSEEKFIRLLNQVRNNELDEEGRKILDSRFQPGFRRRKQDGYIVLTTHNYKAAEINAAELDSLEEKVFTYDAEIQDDFPDRAYPADETLRLKVGAQVMFIRNDAAEKGKRYFNGKIGIISRLATDSIFVRCDGEEPEIEVQKEKWENIHYTLNKTTRQVDPDVLGSFVQYPLRLAWAITIHKSQGLTFEKAIIDAGAAFAPGQVYVALSRCTSLEGLVLQSQVRSSALFSDPGIVAFSARTASGDLLQQELTIARKQTRQTTLLALFDFKEPISNAKEVRDYLIGNLSSFNKEAVEWTDQLMEKLDKLQATATKFQGQLKALFVQPEAPETNQLLPERIRAAAGYFLEGCGLLLKIISQSPAITDSRLHSKEYNDTLRDVFAQLAMKKFLLEGFTESPFDIETFYRLKQQFVLPPFMVNAYAGASQKRTDSPHPALHQQLRKLRDSICLRKNLPLYIVAGSNTIDEMALYLPGSLVELRKISGFGDAKTEKYGQEFLDLITAYCKENNLSSRIQEKTQKRERKEKTGEKKTRVDTKTESFRLFREGRSIYEIAKERNFTRQTIEGHLAFYVEKGEISIEELISREKLLLIEPVIKDLPGAPLAAIRQQLGNEVGFGEIKLVIAWAAFRNANALNE